MGYYEKHVKKINKQGNPELYKKVTREFFNSIKLDLDEVPIIKGKESIKAIEINNLTYDQSYDGDNSVVTFQIKECPDWIFRIQWHPKHFVDKKYDKRLQIDGEFFCTYEPTLDKFNYYHTNLKSEVIGRQLDKNKANEWSVYITQARDIIEFIIKEPYLAFCRDYYGWDYNKEFHSRESAKRKFEKWKEYSELSKKVNTECDEKLLNYIKENILHLYGPNAIIVDRGSNWSPRYEIACKASEFTLDPKIEPGCYSIAKEYKEEYEALEKFEDSLLKYAEDQKVVWYPYSVIDLSITIIADKKWDDYMRFIEKEKNGY